MPSPFLEIRHVKKRALLASYSQCGNLSHAAVTAGCDRRTHYDWLHTDSAYAAAFEQAKAMACDRIEQEIHRRGVEGWEEPVYHGGQQVGVVRRYSDTLLIFLAKGMMPAKYRDRHEVTHDLVGLAGQYAELPKKGLLGSKRRQAAVAKKTAKSE